jgi:hypothetical protein
MEILINLSDSVYDAIKNKYTLVNPKEGTLIKTLWDAVENGTPLPKGYGDLVDYEELKNNAREYGAYAEAILSHIKPKTIIGADRRKVEE